MAPLLLLLQVLGHVVTWRSSVEEVLAVLGLVLLALCSWCPLRSRRLGASRAPVGVDPT